MTIKVLNLYVGIGGNRKLWTDVDVTAVENNPKIAAIYQKFFPNDKVIVADAHQFLLDHFKEYDFIWSSPPCPTHSDMRRMGVQAGMYDAVYPDMKLYEEIIMLKHFCKCLWVVENVQAYYEPLIDPQKSGRHWFWSNFIITNIKLPPLDIRSIGGGSDRKERDMVNPDLGLHVFRCAFKTKQKTLEVAL
jgi:DNA (cytosine-5)-methyltransferase 1